MKACGMNLQATPITLTPEERETLESLVHSGTSEQRLALRGRIILAAARGIASRAIARELKVRPATVSKWRTRFAAHGVQGLQDSARPGARRRYDETTERRILARLDEPPPSGHATWTGSRVAEGAGRRLQASGLAGAQAARHPPPAAPELLRQHRPEFAAKAAHIVGLYLDPPENAVVFSVDERPHIQALERAQGYLRLPNGRALPGFSHEYRRHGTTTLFAAVDVPPVA